MSSTQVGSEQQPTSGLPVAVWPRLTWDWLEAHGFLK